MKSSLTPLALAIILAGAATTVTAANMFRVPLKNLQVSAATTPAPPVVEVPVVPAEPEVPVPPAPVVINDLTLSGPLDFGQVLVGGSSSLALTLTNPGTNPSVAVTSLTSDNAAFTVDSTCVTTLAPGQQCTASVTFTSALPVTYSANLTAEFATGRTVSTTLQGVAQANLANVSGARQWSDGTLAASCNAYRNPTGFYVYQGATGDGVYRITPEGGSTQTVYCDMTTDGGGWALVARWNDFGNPGGPDRIEQGAVMVRGTALPGWSNDASRPAFNGTNRFSNMRFDSSNATWNATYGTSSTAGLKFATWASWPNLTSAAQFRVNPTNLNGATNAAAATVSLVSVGWFGSTYPDSISATAWYFGLLTTDSRFGVCGGASNVGTQQICPILAKTGGGASAHFDNTTVKHLWGR